MANYIDKDFLKLRGTITHITPTSQIPRKGNRDLLKKVLTIETFDNQKLFPELRNNRIKILEKNQITTGDVVEIEFSFEGSEKNGKRYNNIYLHTIKKV